MPRVAGHQHEFGRALGHDSVEGGEQGIDLGFASIQLLGNHATGPSVVRAERERLDRPRSLPFR